MMAAGTGGGGNQESLFNGRRVVMAKMLNFMLCTLYHNLKNIEKNL